MSVRSVLVVVVLVVVAGACSSSSSKGATSTTPPTAGGTPPSAAPSKLTILVTNDDGYSAPGIDAMVQALVALPGVQVTVVAPLKNQSGTGGKTTPGALHASHLKTASGYAATAVNGYPADAVRYALNTEFSSPPDLVVSGINNGQNVGPFIAISGTIGAAKAAAVAGIPAIAVSAGLGNPPDFADAAQIVVSWIGAHSSEYGGAKQTNAQVININVPTCTTGSLRGRKQVPAAVGLDGRNITTVDCESTVTKPADDVAAFLDGFTAITSLDNTGATVTATTAYNG
jgi:5'-nucleotidase